MTNRQRLCCGLLLLAALGGDRLLAAAFTAPSASWQNLAAGGTFEYQWALTKTANGASSDSTSTNVPLLRVSKGAEVQVSYKIEATRTVNPNNQALTASGALVLTNGDATDSVVISGLTLVTQTTAGGSVSTAASCTTTSLALPATLAPGGTLTCTFTNLPYKGYPTDGQVVATISYNSVVPSGTPQITSTSGAISYTAVPGRFSTALLTDKFNFQPILDLYNGFTGFTRDMVWRYNDPAAAIPDAGVLLDGSTVKEYTITAGDFIVCTSTDGITVSNTATLTPQSVLGNGVAIPKTAYVKLQVYGCDLPPTVVIQDLATWAAQSFSWAVTHTARTPSREVQADAGSVPLDYTISARASPTTVNLAVSGAIFINNVQPGVLMISRLAVQLSNGQTAYPNCALTSTYTLSGGLYYTGTNALIAGVGVNSGYTQFLMPEFSSATCRFNMTFTTFPGATLQITPQLNWGFGGVYQLNNPPTLEARFMPPNNFYPVGGCLRVSNNINAGALQLANNGPNQVQMCVTGTLNDFAQPAPLDYSAVATINPAAVGCQGNGEKLTFPINNVATGTPADGFGSPVTANADAVTLTVDCPKAQPQSTAQLSEAAVGTGNLDVSVGGYRTYVASANAWSITKAVDSEALSIGLGDPPKTITYTLTLTKQPATDYKFYVFGRITAVNSGNAAIPVTAVMVTAGNDKVTADCPPLPATIAPGDNLGCTFNVSWNRGLEAGSLGAQVDTPERSFFGPPAGFDFTAPVRTDGADGATAQLTDDFNGTAPPAAKGVPAPWYVAKGAPPAAATGLWLDVADSKQYTYTVDVGPFTDPGSCGAYTLTDVAAVVPNGAASLATSARTTVAVSVTGCGGGLSFQEARSDLAATVDSVAPVRVTTNTWRVEEGVATPLVAVAYDKSAPVQFTVKFLKLPTATFELGGSVTVLNTNGGRPLDLSSLTVSVKPAAAAGAAPGAAAPPPKVVDASCGKPLPLQVPPGGTVSCKFTTTVDADSPGEAFATITDGTGLQSESVHFPFTFDGAATRPADNSPDCAMATVGQVVGLPAWQPDGRAASAATETKICETETVVVPATAGPFRPDQCGTLELTALASVRPMPPAGATATPAAPAPAGAAAAKAAYVTVGGCPPGAVASAARPVITVAPPKASVREAYDWMITLNSDAPNPLVVPQSAPAKVNFVAVATRLMGKVTAAVEGTVTLEAPTAAPLTLSSATVAIYDGRATYTTAPLDCGPASQPGGGVALPGKGSPVTCTYKASGLAPSGASAVLPVVLAAPDAGPAPANPVAFDSASAPRTVTGDCADAGDSLALMQGGKAASWQPAFSGAGSGSGPICDGGDHTRKFGLVFGAGTDGTPANVPCGDYSFVGTTSLVPRNGDAVTAEVDFGVRVTGCRRHRHRHLLR